MDTSQIASLDDVQEYAAGIPSKWVECREGGHQMGTHLARLTEDGGSFLRVKRCRRCSTKRTQVLSLKGLILHTEYEYPEGYTLPKGTGRIDSDGRGHFRVTAILREIGNRTTISELASARRSRAKKPAVRKSA